MGDPLNEDQRPGERHFLKQSVHRLYFRQASIFNKRVCAVFVSQPEKQRANGIADKSVDQQVNVIRLTWSTDIRKVRRTQLTSNTPMRCMEEVEIDVAVRRPQHLRNSIGRLQPDHSGRAEGRGE
ncbi:hypothetical protein AX768_28165 [Burkholderia sp. PAMC 28687]|uniref:hypothetical protein n=1 Tax=Burkholderia sp. PAMC 28687 TaxID=1795874 RepID=UPI000782DDB8|nr:hypothetical protein [Burkholderia sp. PAMC 28687]AMM18000.1 hypothetical protein AX768_28165 [Burkholderia sp. PAMC 28687]